MGVPRSAVLLPLLLLLLLMPTECQDDQQTEELEDESLARLGLLKQRDAIDNWADFAAATNIRGWDQATPICSWTGVFCISTSTVDGFSVSLACDKEMSGASLCAPTPATGTLILDVP
ncbi:expressed protein [Chlorella variabilis]|uniref:Expressed protein n=1 Tax=Chlorella variabilis TaxID=554065 RepID=E1ZJN0_CHLVA|nr:expressed protein [Chlorella variabilis]EFN53894.1 expressed protein [Chlorella variabilis]|eukprot:XP_005845996.1 expressed protein [Chlorella variabilis]